MLGNALFVAPVLTEGATERDVTLPADTEWYDAATGSLATSSSKKPYSFTIPVTLDSVPSYLRGGSIIPIRERARRSAAAAAEVVTPAVPSFSNRYCTPETEIHLGCPSQARNS